MLLVDLTCLQKHMQLPGDALEQSVLLHTDREQFVALNRGAVVQGVVKSVSSLSMRAVYVELSNEHTGFLSVFGGIVPPSFQDYERNLQVINNLEQHFRPGQILTVRVAPNNGFSNHNNDKDNDKDALKHIPLQLIQTNF